MTTLRRWAFAIGSLVALLMAGGGLEDRRGTVLSRTLRIEDGHGGPNVPP
jgi:hypothetical protein